MSLLVEQFLQEPARTEFRAFQENIDTTIAALDLHEPDSSGFQTLVYGSGADAIQGINTASSRPDLDVIVSPEKIQQLRRKNPGRFDEYDDGRYTTYRGTILRSSNIPLSVDITASNDPSGIFSLADYEAYFGGPTDWTIEMSGLQVISAVRAASNKVRSDLARKKDVESLIRAHFVAEGSNHPITQDKVYREAVRNAVNKVVHNKIKMTLEPRVWRRVLNRPNYASWLRELKKSGFKCPPFEFLHQS